MRSSEDPFVVVAALLAGVEPHLALSRAVALTSRFDGAALHAVSLLEHRQAHSLAKAEALGTELDRLQRELEGLLSTLVAAGRRPRLTAHAHTILDRKGEALLLLAAQLEADLIIVDAGEPHGPEHSLRSSIAAHVMRGAGCPVLVVRPKSYQAGAAAPATELELPHDAQVTLEHHARANTYHYVDADTTPMNPWGFGS